MGLARNRCCETRIVRSLGLRLVRGVAAPKVTRSQQQGHAAGIEIRFAAGGSQMKIRNFASTLEPRPLD